MSLPGGGRVVAGAVPWRGAERRALRLPISRFKVASVYLLVAATLGFFGFITVMAFIQYSTPEWARLVIFTVIAAAALAVCVSVAVGPNELALLRDGILLRSGLQARFIPWESTADIERAADVLLQTLHDVYGLPSDGRPIALLAAGGHTLEVG